MRTRRVLLAVVLLSAVACVPGREARLVVGAVYPTGGGQGPGGVEELRGVRLAAERANAGPHRESIEIREAPADSAEAAPSAVRRLVRDRVRVILGSYGSTISRPAAETATRSGALFWETGAVGELSMGAAAGERVFRFPPSGAVLGRSAVSFVRDQLAPKLSRPHPLRYGVAYVDDVYGRSVGNGALDEIRSSGLDLAGTFPYTLPGADFDAIASGIAESGADVLVVSAYLDDGVALREATIRRKVPLAASIGTSSSYCMPEFGRRLGAGAVGLFASDKPDGDVLDPSTLAPGAAAELRWARDEYRRRYDEPMSAPALSGFAAAWALFHHVLPKASASTPAAIAKAARSIALDRGALPNGAGLAFAPPGSAEAGDNLRAAGVIWEWVRPVTRAVVYPDTFATEPIAALPIS